METVCTSFAVAAAISFAFVVAINGQHCPAIPRRRWHEATRPEKFEPFAVTNCQKFVDSFDGATRVTLTFQNLSKLSNVA